MKSNAIKMMILLLATALLCFGTTLTVSANVDGADDEPAIEATTDDGMDNDAADVVEEATEGESDDEAAVESADEDGDDGGSAATEDESEGEDEETPSEDSSVD